MIKCGLTKTFECFGLCTDWILSVVCKCSKNQINLPTPVLQNFCPMIMPCVQYSIEFSYKNNLAKKYFSKFGFPKPPGLRLHYQHLIWGMKNISKSIFETYQVQDSPKPQKYIFKSYFIILFKGFFFSPEMVFNRLKLFLCFKIFVKIQGNSVDIYFPYIRVSTHGHVQNIGQIPQKPFLDISSF